MAKLLGNILPWGTGGSWVFKYGDAVVGNFEKESFLVSDYGSSAKAKAAALKYQKDPKLQTRLKNNSITGKLAKQYGLTYDQYEALPQAKRTELAVKTSRDKIRNIKIEEGGFEQTFKHKGKTYTIPTKFPKDQIPKLKKFLKSFNEWKSKGGTLLAYANLKGRGQLFDKTEGSVWRRLIDYAQSGGKTARQAPGGTSGQEYIKIFKELDLPKKDTDLLKTFTTEARWTVQAGKASIEGAKANVGNPLVKPVLVFLKNNPNATEEELFAAIRKTEGTNLTNSEILKGAVRAHANGAERLLREGRKEEIGKFRFKGVKDFTSNQLQKLLPVLYHLFPNQIHREFTNTVRGFYEGNPTLQKRALDKLEAYNKIRKQVIDKLELGKGIGRGKAPFQFDHPISFEVLKRGGDIEGAIRTNPIAGDVNQLKMKLDRRLSELQRSVISGTNVETNLSKIDSLKNINKTLFGKLAGDFTIDAKGKIKVMDYGAKTVLDPTYDILKSLKTNLPLGKHIQQTVAAGALNPQLKEVLGEKVFKTFTDKASKLKTVFNAEKVEIQRHIANALNCGGAEGGRIGYALGTPTVNCVNTKLTNEPVQSSMRLRAAEGVGRIKNVAQGFLGALRRFGPGAGKFGAIAAVGALAQPLVKQFRNDDPFTYLTDPDQQAGMLDALIEGERPQPRSKILDTGVTAAHVAGTAAAVPGTGALWKARRKPFTRMVDGVAKTRPGMGVTRAALGPVGKFIAGAYTPAGLLAMEPLRIAQMRREGESWGEVAKSPTLWMGPAFADTMTKMATAGMKGSPRLARALSLGMSRPMLKTISRRFGMPGLALSLGLSGYDKYKDWKNKRGWFARNEE